MKKLMIFVVAAMLLGCLMFYTGSEEGPFSVVAVRDEPGRPQEVILQAGGRANWHVVVGPIIFLSKRCYLCIKVLI